MPNIQTIRSRKQIQDAFLELLKKKPYKKISVTEITKNARLSRRTFYAHFETKDALFQSLVDDILGPILTELSKVIEVSIYGDDSEGMFIKLFQAWEDNQEAISIIRQSGGEMLILVQLRSWFSQMYHEAVKPQITEDKAALGEYMVCMIAGASYMALTRWADEKYEYPPELMGKYLFSILGPPSIKDQGIEYMTIFNNYITENQI